MNWRHQDTTGASTESESQGSQVVSVSHKSPLPCPSCPLQGDGRDDLGSCSLCLLSPCCDGEEWRWSTDNPWTVLGHGPAGDSASSSGQSVVQEEDGNFQVTVVAG